MLKNSHSLSSVGEMLPILDEDILYEKEILRTPNDIRKWLRYIEYKAQSGINEQVFIFERACQSFPRSYKLWKLYLDLRVNHLKGLNSARYHEEFQKVNNCFERALILLNKMPRIWSDYLEFRLLQQNVTSTRKTFDKALQALPAAQHSRLWPLYIKFATEHANSATSVHIWKRYIEFNRQKVEDYIDLLVEKKYYQQAAEKLIEVLDDAKFESSNGKSRFQLWNELADLLVHHARKIKGINTERIIRSGIQRYVDQKGRLWVSLATYWTNRGDFDKARDILEEGISTAMTMRDFTQIFDAYAEFEESLIAKMLEREEKEKTQKNDKNLHKKELDSDIDRLMERFEQLMDRRAFMVNDVLLRKDPNSVVEWEKRIGLWGEDHEQVVKTYTDALATINPKKANGKLYKLWANYAAFYDNQDDLDTARIIFDKATKVPYKSVNELSEVWIEWAEMELRHGDFDRAIRVMEKATVGPKRSTIDYFDDSKSPQERLHKSMKVWSFYVDLVESAADEQGAEGLEKVKQVYDRIFELKIGTPLTIVNYANLLQENHYFEESFKIYERGIELFSYPVAFEIWNIYLNKAVERQLSVERLRDLFEQALAECPPNLSKPIYILYGQFEEQRGLTRNAMKIYDKASRTVSDEDKPDMYKYYIERVTESFGLPATRPIFERAIDTLPSLSARDFCEDFIAVEIKLGEIDRARTLFGYGSQFSDPRISSDYWDKWEQFEVDYGNEETYREMLRIKRSVAAQFSTDIGHIAAQAVALGRNEETTESTKDAMADLEAQTAAPIGFVASSEKVQQKAPAADVNPDKIELDMDDL